MLVGSSVCHDGNVFVFNVVKGFVAFVYEDGGDEIDIPGFVFCSLRAACHDGM